MPNANASSRSEIKHNGITFEINIHNEKIYRDIPLNNSAYLIFPSFLKTQFPNYLTINSNFSRIDSLPLSNPFAAVQITKNRATSVGGECFTPFIGTTQCNSVITQELNSGNQQKMILQDASGLDQHDLITLTDGAFLGIRYKLTSCETQRKLCNLQNSEAVNQQKFADCEIVEFDSKGKLHWNWLASQHINPTDILWDFWKTDIKNNGYYDPFHCNSIDIRGSNLKELLLSMRHTNSLYSINFLTGQINWKLGGVFNQNQSLTPALKDFPIDFGGQHDARWINEDSISLLDNSTNLYRPSRGIIIKIKNSKYNKILEFRNPDGGNSRCMGSFRRVNINSTSYFIAGWGCSVNGATLFSGRGVPIVSISMPYEKNMELMVLPQPSLLNTAIGYRVVHYKL